MKLNRVKLKLRLEKFLRYELWQHIIVIAFVCLCAWLFNKPFEAVMFCISHIVIRKRFDKQYHCVHYKQAIATVLCLVTTLTIIWFGISYLLPTTLSLLSAVPVCFVISWIGYLAQDRLDQIAENKHLQNEIDSLLIKVKEYENIDWYKMTESELRQYGASKMLSEIQQDILVMRVIEHLKISEICKYRNYGRTTIKYHISEIKRKLNLAHL